MIRHNRIYLVISAHYNRSLTKTNKKTLIRAYKFVLHIYTMGELQREMSRQD